MPKFEWSHRSALPGRSTLTTRDRIQFAVLGVIVAVLAIFVFFSEEEHGPVVPLPAAAAVTPGAGDAAAPQRLSLPPTAVLNATPNPVKVCDGGGGVTLIEFAGNRPGMYAIHLGSKDGPLFARFSTQGAQSTGRWVTDGARFVAVEEATGRVVASVTVGVTTRDCRPARARPDMRWGGPPAPG